MSDIIELDGPTQEPSSGGPAKQLVIFCHGVGSDGNDLIGLAPYFARVLPEAKFVSPNAPEKFDMAATGYQWFSISDPDAERLSGVQSVAPILEHFINQQMTGEIIDLTKKTMRLATKIQYATIGIPIFIIF